MIAKTVLTYEAWDRETPHPPQRSRLYQLMPVGIGTLNVESLTSYTGRLAEAHCVSVDTLFTRLLVPSTKKSTSAAGIKRALTPSFQLRSRALNGTGVMSAEWVGALERSTLRRDLRFLTMLNWADVLSQRRLLRRTRAWCPLCYDGWRVNGHIVYDPLIWGLDVFTVCPKHQQRLHLRCAYCDRTLPSLDRHSKPGHCSKCGEWLGAQSETASAQNRVLGTEELEWQTWIAGAIRELFAVAIPVDSSFTRATFPAALSRLIEQAAAGNLSRFASMIGRQKTTVWGWQKGETRITLTDLLSLCYCMDISVVHLLTNDFDFMKRGSSLVQLRRPFNRSARTRRARRQFDSDKVHIALKRILDDEDPPPSMQTVATRLGYDTRFLTKKFRELCRAVSIRFAQFQRTCREQRIQQCRTEVRQVALKLLSGGSYPSRRRVSLFLRRPSDIERKEAYDVLRELRQELHLDKCE